MPASTLDPDNLPSGKNREGPTGHDTKTLGPSDSSDSGSDMAGPGLVDDDELDLDRGTNEDTERGTAASTDAGPSVGDVDMDSDSDRYGTGEATTAGKEPRARGNADIGTDRVVGELEAGLGAGLDQAEEAQLGITDEEIERELGIEREPFETEDQAELLRTPVNDTARGQGDWPANQAEPRKRAATARQGASKKAPAKEPVAAKATSSRKRGADANKPASARKPASAKKRAR